jgi:hypothetical protein
MVGYRPMLYGLRPHQRHEGGVPRLAHSQALSEVRAVQELANHAPDLWYVERVDPEAGHGKRCSFRKDELEGITPCEQNRQVCLWHVTGHLNAASPLP